jgi:hypothetical protein
MKLNLKIIKMNLNFELKHNLIKMSFQTTIKTLHLKKVKGIEKERSSSFLLNKKIEKF